MNQRNARTCGRPLLTVAACLLAMLGIAPRLLADTIVLKSGKRLEGTIVEETPTRVVLKRGGMAVEYRPGEIEEIRRGSSGSVQTWSAPAAHSGARATTAAVQGRLTQDNDVLTIRDAIAIRYDDGSLHVTFLPFRLSDADLDELRGGKDPFRLVADKPNPNPAKWPACPYIQVKIRLAEGTEARPENVSDYHFVIYETLYRGMSFQIEETGPEARAGFQTLDLSMEGDEGTLEIAFAGNKTETYTIASPPRDYRYKWGFRGRARVLQR